MTKTKIFRQEAIDAKKQQWMGEILLLNPIGFSLFVTFAVCVVGALGIFLAKGEFTRKERVGGRIVSVEGMAKIYSPLTGTVVKKMVREGDRVSKGQILYLISMDRSTADGGVQEAIGTRIASKRKSLGDEFNTQRRVLAEEQAALDRRVVDLSAQLQNLRREIVTQTKRVQLSETNLERFRELSASKFVSSAQLTDREQDKLDQESRLQNLQRTELTISTDIAAAQSALRNAPLNAANKLSGIQRGISSTEQESYENEARRELAITALQDGVATIVMAEVGQTVNPALPMLSILPTNGSFEAYLYVPSRAIGFMREGGRALLRYQAFPYQKFGQYGATIKTISRSALSPAELQVLNAPQETLYRVTVALDKQKVLAYGQTINLQDGMALEADVLLDTRKLYEWLLEPLYSVTGKL